MDFGVLPFLYDGMFANNTGENVLAKIFPITVDEIGSGIVVGSANTKIITKLNGSYTVGENGSNPVGFTIVHLYHEGLLTRNFTVAGATVQLTFADGEMAVIEADATLAAATL